MNNLKEHILESLSNDIVIDGHIHCIGGKQIPRTADIQVCALNDWPDMPRVENYTSYEPWFGTDDYVIGVGASEEEMAKMLADDRFDGYGEFLAYKILKDNKIINRLDELKKVANLTSKPIYVHFDLLPDNYDTIFRFLNTTNNKKIVLCHCGLSRRTDDDMAFQLFIRLINDCPNLYGDISWHTLTYIIENPEKLLQCPSDRIIVGTDCSERDSDLALKHRKENFLKIASRIDNTKNIRKLFQR